MWVDETSILNEIYSFSFLDYHVSALVMVFYYANGSSLITNALGVWVIMIYYVILIVWVHYNVP